MSVQLRDRPAGDSSVVHEAAHFVDTLLPKPERARRLSIVFVYVTVIEFLVVGISTYAGSAAYHYLMLRRLPSLPQYVDAALFIATIFTMVSLGFRHYLMLKKQQLHMSLWSGVGAVAITFALFLSTLFLLKVSKEYSRGALIFELGVVSISVCIFRTISILSLRSAVASGDVEARRAVLIGDPGRCPTIIEALKAGGIRVVDLIRLPHIQSGDHTFSMEKDVRRTVDLCRSTLPDDIVILATQDDLSSARNLAQCLSEIPCSVHIAPLDDVRFIGRSQIVDLGSVMTLQVSKPPLSMGDLAIKRAFDIVVATAALVALSPLLIFVALAIKLDSAGSILFRQERHGYNNRVIRVFKFRSMVTMQQGDAAFQATTPDDGRVTAVGRILRRTNIDELPQLLNVLLGEMSIVGPRPHATLHNEMFEDQILPFARRHNVKPGITGWAQVNGYRGAADTVEKMRRRVEYDLHYIDNWSFFLDLKIIMMTLFSKKAYMNAY
jgi:Undecaprenyl-phosphate glucose phosphotransferase